MRYVILGKGGHAKVVRQACWTAYRADEIIMVGEGDHMPYPYDGLVIGVGDLETRIKLFNEYPGASWPWLQHSSARCHSGDNHVGLQVMMGAMIQCRCEFGVNILVNTGAQIDHDCKIGDHCVISPGAVLCGGVTLGEACFVGASATILEGVTLDAGTTVPAGTLVVKSDDFRKPVPMVRRDGADKVEDQSDWGCISHIP